MANLNSLDLSQLKQFVDDPETHINNFIHTFEKTFEEVGPNSFVPMVTMFKNPEEFIISIQSRYFEDKDDMYKAFNEMLHFYSAAECHSFIFASDVTRRDYDQDNPNTKTTEPVEALCLAFVSDESSGMVSLPYSVIDNKVVWSEKDFDLSNLAEDNPEKTYQGDIPELFYMMTHLQGAMFSTPQILNYLNYKGFQYVLSDASEYNSIKVKIK